MSAPTNAAFWIAHLGLIAHPEGGYYQESYRSSLVLPGSALQPLIDGPRAASTAIYFLVTAQRPSCLHRLQADEIWHFYAGDTLEICCIAPDGQLEIKRLGANVGAGDRLQHVVEAGTWFGARVLTGGQYALCGCTMAPGFDFADFELGQRSPLLAAYPQQSEIIAQLTTH